MHGFNLDTDPAARLTDRARASRPLEMPLHEAQAWVNFTVHAPGVMPDGCRPGPSTVRPEQAPGRPDGLTPGELGQTPWSEANPCSVRTVLGGRGRTIRIKQFLYDWAPPAAWIAPLWDSPWLEPVPCRRAVGWLGTDYREALGACVQLERTQIELSVVEGTFEPAELAMVLQAMAPANAPAALRVRRAPFHRLNYWVRYRVPPYRVPYGLWKYPQRRLYHLGRRLNAAALRAVEPVRVLLPAASGFTLDSALLISEPGMRHHEVEVLLHRRGEPGGTLWISCMREGSDAELPVPPEPESQHAAVREPRRVSGTTVWHAALTREHGAHEAFWSAAGHRYAVWSAPGRETTTAWFTEVLKSMRSA